MTNRFPTYSSEAAYLAAKDSLIPPYVATYPSSTAGKTVVVYGNVDGTNQSEVIATAQLTDIITAIQSSMNEVIAEKDSLIYDMEQEVIIERKGFNSVPLLCGQPMILFGAGTPQESIVPSNWKQFDPITGEGYNWNGIPSAEGQQYINTSVDTNGRYIAVKSGYGLTWKPF